MLLIVWKLAGNKKTLQQVKGATSEEWAGRRKGQVLLSTYISLYCLMSYVLLAFLKRLVFNNLEVSGGREPQFECKV